MLFCPLAEKVKRSKGQKVKRSKGQKVKRSKVTFGDFPFFSGSLEERLAASSSVRE